MHRHSRWMVSKNHQLLTIWCTHAVGHHKVFQLIYQGETQCFSKIDLTQWKINLQQHLTHDLNDNCWTMWHITNGWSKPQSKHYFYTRWLIQKIHYRNWRNGKRASRQVDYNIKNKSTRNWLIKWGLEWRLHYLEFQICWRINLV